MTLKDVGEMYIDVISMPFDPDVIRVPTGISPGEYVHFIESEGRYYINLSGTDDKFRRISYQEYVAVIRELDFKKYRR